MRVLTPSLYSEGIKGSLHINSDLCSLWSLINVCTSTLVQTETGQHLLSGLELVFCADFVQYFC